ASTGPIDVPNKDFIAVSNFSYCSSGFKWPDTSHWSASKQLNSARFLPCGENETMGRTCVRVLSRVLVATCAACWWLIISPVPTLADEITADDPSDRPPNIILIITDDQG